MTAPEPHEPMQQLAQRGAQTWQEDVLRDFDARHKASQATAALLEVPTGPRLTVWTELFQQFAIQRRAELATSLAQHVGPIANQAYSALEDVSPRPTLQVLGNVTAANQLVAGIIAATATQQATAVTITPSTHGSRTSPDVPRSSNNCAPPLMPDSKHCGRT